VSSSPQGGAALGKKKEQMVSVNQRAMEIVRRIIMDRETLNVGVSVLDNGSTIIDMGVNHTGGWSAAKHLVEVTLGGLGILQYGLIEMAGLELPQAEIYVEKPVTACLSCQLSGWPLPDLKTESGIVPLISGPVRAVVREDRFARAFSYQDRNDEVVVALQGGLIPDTRLTDYIAAKCGLDPKQVFILTAATGSVAGMVNVAARTLETTLWRLHELGFNPEKVITAWGKAPVPPVSKDEYKAMIRANTYIYYGGTVGLTVECEDEEITKILAAVPLSPETSDQYGTPFGKLLDEADGNIFQMTGFVHSVTKVIFYNAQTGKTFKCGENNFKMLLDCL
jgi:methenyltetrahydromethanopterin cyclohydrolase